MADLNVELNDSTLVKALTNAVPMLKYDLGGTTLATDLQTILAEVMAAPKFGEPDFSLFRYPARPRQKDTTFALWQIAILGALHVLKWHDQRENPGGSRTAKLTTPDVRELVTYYQGLRLYEPVLYGSDPRYRDHFAHVLRVWMTGILIISKLGADALESPRLTETPAVDRELFSSEEVCGMFTVAALTHDMGYPLQTLTKVNDVVGKLLQSFGGVDWQQLRVTFSLPQHAFAQELLKQLSSQPRFRELANGARMADESVGLEASKLWKLYGNCKTIGQYKETHKNLPWAVMLRSQWKYHQKYSASLEQGQHGFLSALLLQRKLLYFREGEFALEEDYPFRLEEARQFMIRRNILRAVTSHTCPDIYFLSPLSTEAVLFFCDEMQDWGRPYFRDLYGLDTSLGMPRVVLRTFDSSKVSWSMRLEKVDIEAFAWKLFSTANALYVRLRSAPYSEGRQFGVEWEVEARDIKRQGYFKFDKDTKGFTCSVINIENGKSRDVIDLLDAYFTGSLDQEAIIDQMQSRLKAV